MYIGGAPPLSEEEVRFVAEIPESLKRLVDAREEDNKQIAKEALWNYVGGPNKAYLERRIDDLQNEIQSLNSERNTLGREIDNKEEQLEILKKRLNDASKGTQLNDDLERLSEDLENGAHVFVGHGEVKEVARRHDMAQVEIIERLKEMNPDIPDKQFRDGYEGQR